MVKCYVSHAASHRGRSIDVAEDGSCQLADEALAEMRPHGFREWEQGVEPPPAAMQAVAPSELTRSELLASLKGKVSGTIVTKTTDELRALASTLLPDRIASEEKAPLSKNVRRNILARRPLKDAPKQHGQR